MQIAMINPVNEFLKYAKSTQVRPHSRRTNQKVVQVKGHGRDVGDEDPKAQKVDEALREAELRGRQAKELKLWTAWKDGGMRAEDLGPLLRSFKPMIQSKAGVYKGKLKFVPDASIEVEFQLRFVDALRSYDPSKGSLGTHVYRSLDKAKRFIADTQNVGRIPENRIYRIGQFKAAKDELSEELGQPPTTKDLSQRLGWSLAETERMDSEDRNELMAQGFEEDPTSLTPSKSEEVLRLFKYELHGKERMVYEHLTGLGRPQITSTGGIAKKMKIPDYQVSRIKNAIQKKLKRYMTE